MIEQTVASCVFASFVLPAAPPAPPAPEAPPCSAPEQVSWLALLAEPVPVPAAGGCGLAASSLSSSLFGVIPPCTPDLQPARGLGVKKAVILCWPLWSGTACAPFRPGPVFPGTVCTCD